MRSNLYNAKTTLHMHIPMGNSGSHGHGFASNHNIRNDNLESEVCMYAPRALWRGLRRTHKMIKLTEIAKSACHPLKSEQLIYVSRDLVCRKIFTLFPSFIVSCLFLLGCGAEENLWAFGFFREKVPAIPR